MKNYVTTTLSKQKYATLYQLQQQKKRVFRNDKIAAVQPLGFSKTPYYVRPKYNRIFYDCAKRGIDISVSISLLVAALPIIVAIIALIKLTSKGPIIFRQRRLGKSGVEFECFKFRTMVCNAEEQLKNDARLYAQFKEKFKIENDPRVTRVGNYLRRTSLDELPQLVQVLQGKMSLIGPRPVVPEEIEKYSIYAEKLFTVKPGLSGLWQTSGRSNTTYRERVNLDMYYIDNRSLRLELRLLLMTIAAVLKKSGAC